MYYLDTSDIQVDFLDNSTPPQVIGSVLYTELDGKFHITSTATGSSPVDYQHFELMSDLRRAVGQFTASDGGILWMEHTFNNLSTTTPDQELRKVVLSSGTTTSFPLDEFVMFDNTVSPTISRTPDDTNAWLNGRSELIGLNNNKSFAYAFLVLNSPELAMLLQKDLIQDALETMPGSPLASPESAGGLGPHSHLSAFCNNVTQLTLGFGTLLAGGACFACIIASPAACLTKIPALIKCGGALLLAGVTAGDIAFCAASAQGKTSVVSCRRRGCRQAGCDSAPTNDEHGCTDHCAPSSDGNQRCSTECLQRFPYAAKLKDGVYGTCNQLGGERCVCNSSWGDGTVQGNEQCDDPMTNNTAMQSPTCPRQGQPAGTIYCVNGQCRSTPFNSTTDPSINPNPSCGRPLSAGMYDIINCCADANCT